MRWRCPLCSWFCVACTPCFSTGCNSQEDLFRYQPLGYFLVPEELVQQWCGAPVGELAIGDRLPLLALACAVWGTAFLLGRLILSTLPISAAPGPSGVLCICDGHRAQRIVVVDARRGTVRRIAATGRILRGWRAIIVVVSVWHVWRGKGHVAAVGPALGRESADRSAQHLVAAACVVVGRAFRTGDCWWRSAASDRFRCAGVSSAGTTRVGPEWPHHVPAAQRVRKHAAGR